jgi:hypothetical protein
VLAPGPRLSIEVGEPQLNLSPCMRAALQRWRFAKLSVIERAPAKIWLVRQSLRVDFKQRRTGRAFDGRHLGGSDRYVRRSWIAYIPLHPNVTRDNRR